MEYFGFSFEINDEDLRFKLPRQEINGIEYIVLKKLDKNLKENSLDLYYIPFIEGTSIRVLNETFEKNGYTVSTKISCDENGGIYLPILKTQKENKENKEKFPGGILGDTNNETKKETCKEYRTYTIKECDTFYSISGEVLGNEKRYNEIIKLNPSINPRKLKVGEKIIIPFN
jgi:hypothetical protein